MNRAIGGSQRRGDGRSVAEGANAIAIVQPPRSTGLRLARFAQRPDAVALGTNAKASFSIRGAWRAAGSALARECAARQLRVWPERGSRQREPASAVSSVHGMPPRWQTGRCRTPCGPDRQPVSACHDRFNPRRFGAQARGLSALPLAHLPKRWGMICVGRLLCQVQWNLFGGAGLAFTCWRARCRGAGRQCPGDRRKRGRGGLSHDCLG